MGTDGAIAFPTPVIALNYAWFHFALLTKHNRKSWALGENSGKGIFGPCVHFSLLQTLPSCLRQALCSSFPDGLHFST